MYRAWLRSGRQSLTVNGHSSESLSCHSVVPKGVFSAAFSSIFMLMTFLICCYPLQLVLWSYPLELQSVVNLICDLYHDARLLTIQPHKSAALICSIAPQQLHPSSTIIVNKNPIPAVSWLKYLGITFDHKLDFHFQAELAATQGRKVLGSPWHSCIPLLGFKAFCQLYLCKVLPLLTYCISIMAPAHKGAF